METIHFRKVKGEIKVKGLCNGGSLLLLLICLSVLLAFSVLGNSGASADQGGIDSYK
jgi:hypothetical protein